MELWKHPLEGRAIATEMTHVSGLSRQVIVDRYTRSPIRDRQRRMIADTTPDGCLVVYDSDGYEVVSGYVRTGDLLLNMYTGEVFKNNKRIRLPDRGPQASKNLIVAGETRENRPYEY